MMIKRLVLFIGLASLSFLLVSCLDQGSTAIPEDSAKGFMFALAKGDLVGVQKYSSESTNDLLEQLMGMGGNDEPPPEEEMERFRNRIQGVRCAIVNRNTNPNSVICSVCCDANGDPMNLSMVKEGRRWLVQLNKEEFFESFSNFFAG